MRKKSVVSLLIIIVLVIGGVLAFYFFGGRKAEALPATPQMRTTTAEERTYTRVIDISGYVEPYDEEELKFRSTGAVTGVYVDEGDSVLAISRHEGFSAVISSALKGERAESVIETGTRVLQVIASPVSVEASSGAVIIIIDITEKAERERLRREFTANVSHELRTPLTSISGFAEILKNGGIDESTVKDFGLEIYNEAQHLIALVHDIIRLSRLDEGENGEDAVVVDLSDIAEESMQRLKRRAESRGISLSSDVEKGAYVKGSESLLDEMITNLVDNAIKYTDRGGWAKVSVKNDVNSVVLTVSDNGIGIPEEDKEHVFERFYRVDKSRSRASGGTGLGLSIVRHAAIYHNARIELDSRIGKGTRISVIFPKA